MRSFLNWLIGPKIPEGSLGIIAAHESNYLRLGGQTHLPPQWTTPLRESDGDGKAAEFSEEGVIPESKAVHEWGNCPCGKFHKRHYPDALARMRAEEVLS